LHKIVVNSSECKLRWCDETSARAEAMALIRAMIERVVLTPRTGAARLAARLEGALASMLSVCAAAERRQPAVGSAGRLISVVAGARFELTTFRL
jgi:hypothetical protein